MGLMNKPIKIIPLKGTVALTVPLTFGDLFAVIMPVYNKLVRDRIPAIIQESGKKCRTRILYDSEYLRELKAKSQEELHEYLNSKNDKEAVEELADLLEINPCIGCSARCRF